MSKSPEEYREEAHRVRKLAGEMPAPEIRAALWEVAASYEGLAHAAETLAALDSPNFQTDH
jgi:hypothetical protein